MIDELAGELGASKTLDIIKRLESREIEQALPAQMELALLWAIASLGDGEIEPGWFGTSSLPCNFTLAEWQQAKRMDRDPRHLKATIQECWSVSDNRASFAKALETRGLYLAKGDRRTHVAVTYEGEVVSIARMTGVKAKDIAARLGKADELRGVDETNIYIAATIVPRPRELIAIADRAKAQQLVPLQERRLAMKGGHATERQRLHEGQEQRRIADARARAKRLRPGLMRAARPNDGSIFRHGAPVRSRPATLIS